MSIDWPPKHSRCQNGGTRRCRLSLVRREPELWQPARALPRYHRPGLLMILLSNDFAGKPTMRRRLQDHEGRPLPRSTLAAIQVR